MMIYSFSERALEIPNSGIGYMMNYAAKYPDVLSLGQGTPQFPTPEFIYDYVHERARREPSVGMYASPKIENELKDLVVNQMQGLYGFAPRREEICLSVGGIGALFAGLMAVAQKGDEIIFFDPSYPLHLAQIYLTQAKPVFVTLQEDRGWAPDLEKLQSSLSPQTKAIILTNPNNPTGTVWKKEAVESLAQLVIERQLILILDEAYDFLTYEKSLFSPMKIKELRPNIILCKSFSKEFAMTGWRIGYSWSGPEMSKKIAAIHTHFSINPPTPSILAAVAALSDPRGETAKNEFIQKFKESRQVICQRLNGLGKLFAYQKPDGAYYVFPKILGFGNLTSLDFAKHLVDQARVVSIPGSSMGPSGEGHLRFSFATDPSQIDKIFNRLDEFVKNL